MGGIESSEKQNPDNHKGHEGTQRVEIRARRAEKKDGRGTRRIGVQLIFQRHESISLSSERPLEQGHLWRASAGISVELCRAEGGTSTSEHPAAPQYMSPARTMCCGVSSGYKMGNFWALTAAS